MTVTLNVALIIKLAIAFPFAFATHSLLNFETPLHSSLFNALYLRNIRIQFTPLKYNFRSV